MRDPQHPASLASRDPPTAIDHPPPWLEPLPDERIQRAKIERIECLHRYMHHQWTVHLQPVTAAMRSTRATLASINVKPPCLSDCGERGVSLRQTPRRS
jgi:hypothetical protein